MHEFAREVLDGGEDPASDHLSLDSGEPDLDLIQPGRIGRRKVQFHLRMTFQKGSYFAGLMGRQVVDNDVDLLIRPA